MKKVSGLLVLGFLIFATCVLAAPRTFGPPGIAPDPGGDLPVANTLPNIEGTWEGTGRDIHKERYSNPELGGPYDVELTVVEQDGPRFIARFLAVGVSGEFYTSDLYPGVAGHINGEGEITMFGGVNEGELNKPENIRITIKAQLYKNPRRSIRGSWEAIQWGGDFGVSITNSGNFVVYPREYNSDQ